MGKLIEVYQDHEIRWTKTGFHIINPDGVPVPHEVKTIEQAKALIRTLVGDAPQAKPSTLGSKQKPEQPKRKLISPAEFPRCVACEKAPGYMPGQLCGPCWLKEWKKTH